MKEKEIHLRVSMELWKYLGELPDKTEYITNLIDKDRLDRLDSTVINNKIKKHQEAIKELQGLTKAKPINEDKIQELLAYHAPNYKQNALHRTEPQRIRFIEKTVLPQLKRLGYTGSLKEIDNTLINWPEEGVG